MDFLNAAKLLLEIDNNESDELLLYLIDDTISAVLAYCRIEVLPRQIAGFIPQIAARRYRDTKNAGVKSITEGDRRVEYTGGQENFLSEYKNRLAPFVSRKVWLPSDKDKGDTKDDKSV